MLSLATTLAGSVLTLFVLLDKIEVDPTRLGPPVKSDTLKTGDLLLFSESVCVRSMSLACVSHAAVVVCNRLGVPYVYEIRPKEGRPALVPLEDFHKEQCQVYVRQLTTELHLKQVLEYIRLTRDNEYSHTYLRAAFNIPIDSTKPFCSSLVTGLYLFCGVLTSEAALFLPGDLLGGRLPTTNNYRFLPMSLVVR